MSARAGWAKQIDAWRQIDALVQSGERQWGEYLYESNEINFAAGALLAADEMGIGFAFGGVHPG